jgi:hypothetical protein
MLTIFQVGWGGEACPKEDIAFLDSLFPDRILLPIFYVEPRPHITVKTRPGPFNRSFHKAMFDRVVRINYRGIV